MNDQRPGHNANAESQSRRSFIARTAAGAAAAALLGAGAGKVVARPSGIPFAAARRRAPLGGNEPIRMAVIGTGGMGTGHCHSIMDLAKKGHENVHIVALCDVCEPRLSDAKGACESKQGIKVDTYAKHEDLLARDDIHGVLIATTEHWHGKIAEDAILAGKDVYCEKPMTLHLDQALRLREVVQANPQQVFQVGTQMITLPKYTEARKLIESGAIGTPTFSQTSYCRNSKDGEWLYYAIDKRWDPGTNLDWKRWCGDLGLIPWDAEVYARWRRYRKYSTGIIGDLLVHKVTPLLLAIQQGWPTRVAASGGHLVDKAMENHDQVNINVTFETGHVMVIAGSTCNEVGLEDLIRGHKGNIYLNSRHCVLRPERIFVDDVDERTIDCPDIGNDQDQLRLNWLASIRSREPAISNVDLATKVMVVVDLATRSMWDGRAYEFDPSTMTARAV